VKIICATKMFEFLSACENIYGFFEAMPIKWINQSPQTGRGPPDA